MLCKHQQQFEQVIEVDDSTMTVEKTTSSSVGLNIFKAGVFLVKDYVRYKIRY